MLQKFALAFKTKTAELFADDEDDAADEDEDDDGPIPTVDLDPFAAPEEIITNQRVVVLKPDAPAAVDPHSLAASLFAAVSSFRAAYLHLQAAHSPFDPDALRSADQAAVSHLRRLSDLKRSYLSQNPNPNLLPLSSRLEAQVQENQNILRTFETVVNRLQADIDSKDAEAAALKERLSHTEASVSKLSRTLERASSPVEEKVESLLSVGVFNSVLKDCCWSSHFFARSLIDWVKQSGGNLESAAASIYPDVEYAKSRHFRYAILSYVCLGMFEGFDSHGFCVEENGIDVSLHQRESLRQFIEHSMVDSLQLLSRDPNCAFGRFCEKKYQQLISTGVAASILENLDKTECLRSSSPLYEPFVNMASSVWMLHKLAQAYDPMVEIFQVGRGAEFSLVYMESIVGRPKGSDCSKALRPKVGFTVVPGFRVGKTVIQCRVYLDGMKQAL